MADREGFLKTRAAEGLLRVLKPVSWRDNGRIRVDEKEYIDFSSNDYLGLSNHPKLIEQAKQAVDKFGTAGAASRLMSGDLELHHQLEERIAGFKNREAALFFNSGYQANVGIISALYGKGDCIFLDRLSHASIIDGAILSGARVARFAHNDTGHLELLLKKERDKFKSAVIITESVFSMDGDKAPLKQLIQLKEKYNCEMFVDEAHATGIFGGNGSGLAEEEDKEGRIDFLMGTFSKALGGFGAYLAASRKNVEYLVNTCRSFIYSTSLPAGVIAGNLAGIEVIREEPFRRERLLEAAEYFRRSLKNRGFQVSGESQIIPVIIGENLKTQRFAAELRKKGYWVLPVRPPTVPKGEARLRFSLTFGHTREILAKLIDDFSDIRI
ncbi:MAG: 8-amino-7-oxononanoate synthase [Candidatus Omnitrophota bacterium]